MGRVVNFYPQNDLISGSKHRWGKDETSKMLVFRVEPQKLNTDFMNLSLLRTKYYNNKYKLCICKNLNCYINK